MQRDSGRCCVRKVPRCAGDPVPSDGNPGRHCAEKFHRTRLEPENNPMQRTTLIYFVHGSCQGSLAILDRRRLPPNPWHMEPGGSARLSNISGQRKFAPSPAGYRRHRSGVALRWMSKSSRGLKRTPANRVEHRSTSICAAAERTPRCRVSGRLPAMARTARPGTKRGPHGVES